MHPAHSRHSSPWVETGRGASFISRLRNEAFVTAEFAEISPVRTIDFIALKPTYLDALIREESFAIAKTKAKSAPSPKPTHRLQSHLVEILANNDLSR
jgi:hypothetical protein